MEFKDISGELAEVAKNYQRQDLPPWLIRLQESLQQLSQAFQEWWEKLFHLHNPGVSDSRAFSTVVQYSIYVLGVIALLVLAYVLLRRAARQREEIAATRRGAAAVEKFLDSNGYRLEAESLAKANDFKAACRSLYLCLLRYMDEKAVVGFAPAKTNFEYRYLLAEFKDLQSEFMKLADIVEHTWFGNRQADASDYNECLALLSRAETDVNSIAEARVAREQSHE